MTLPRWKVLADRVAKAPAESAFTTLISLSELDPSKDLRFCDWTQISFKNCDLTDYDFTGSRLTGCSFKGAKLSNARFDQAEMALAFQNEQLKHNCPLKAAKDWRKWVQNWSKPTRKHDDTHLRHGAIFQDAPFAPELLSLRGLSGQHFAISIFPVSVLNWKYYLGKRRWHRMAGSSAILAQRDVSWNAAQDYANWLTLKTGKKYRLPTNLEWTALVDQGPALDADKTSKKFGYSLPLISNVWGVYTPNYQEWIGNDNTNPGINAVARDHENTALARGAAHLHTLNSNIQPNDWSARRFKTSYSSGHICFRLMRDMT